MEWKTGKPEFDGKYLVTTLEAMMVDSRHGAHSYAYDVDISVFSENEWDIDGVVAWTELPPAYYPEKG